MPHEVGFPEIILACVAWRGAAGVAWRGGRGVPCTCVRACVHTAALSQVMGERHTNFLAAHSVGS